jgi:2-keto-4-pentenoate hydratase
MQSQQAADFIVGLWRDGSRCSAIPDDLAPQQRAEAYVIQAAFERESAHPLAGWKIAATSIAGQKHINVEGPLLGRYTAERVVPSGGNIPLGGNLMRVAEVEFAFRLARDLPPRNAPYTEQEVFDAVATLHPAIEIPDSRFDDFTRVGAAQLIADNACANWMAIGDAVSNDWRSVDLAQVRPVGRIAGRPDVLGNGSNVLGSPRFAMTWAINELSQHGLTASAGQFITTGTCLVPMPISVGGVIEGDFGSWGKITVKIIP